MESLVFIVILASVSFEGAALLRARGALFSDNDGAVPQMVHSLLNVFFAAYIIPGSPWTF